MIEYVFTEEEKLEFIRIESEPNDEEKSWLNKDQKITYSSYMRKLKSYKESRKMDEERKEDLKLKFKELSGIVSQAGYGIEKEIRLTKDNQDILQEIKEAINEIITDRAEINPFIVDSGELNTEINSVMQSYESLIEELKKIFINIFPSESLQKTFFNPLGRFEPGKFIVNMSPENNYINIYENCFESLDTVIYNVYDKIYRPLRKSEENIDYIKVLDSVNISYITFDNIFKYFRQEYIKVHSKLTDLKKQELLSSGIQEKDIEIRDIKQKINKEMEEKIEFQTLNYYSKLKYLFQILRDNISFYLRSKNFLLYFCPIEEKLLSLGYGCKDHIYETPKDNLYSISQEKVLSILLENINFDKNILFLFKSLSLSKDIIINDKFLAKETTINGTTAQNIDFWIKKLNISILPQNNLETVKKLLHIILPKDISQDDYLRYFQEVKMLFARTIPKLSQKLIGIILLELNTIDKLPIPIIKICILMEILGKYLSNSDEKVINLAILINKMIIDIEKKITPFTVGKMDRIKRLLERNNLNIDSLAKERISKYTFYISSQEKNMTLSDIHKLKNNIEINMNQLNGNISQINSSISIVERKMSKIVNENKAKKGFEILSESVKTHVGYTISSNKKN